MYLKVLWIFEDGSCCRFCFVVFCFVCWLVSFWFFVLMVVCFVCCCCVNLFVCCVSVFRCFWYVILLLSVVSWCLYFSVLFLCVSRDFFCVDSWWCCVVFFSIVNWFFVFYKFWCCWLIFLFVLVCFFSVWSFVWSVSRVVWVLFFWWLFVDIFMLDCFGFFSVVL